MLTVFGVVALTFMILMYALKSRGRAFILAFAFGCLLSGLYDFMSGAWPFGVVEAIWCVVAFRRFFATMPGPRLSEEVGQGWEVTHGQVGS